jgi:hypothetical protein
MIIDKCPNCNATHVQLSQCSVQPLIPNHKAHWYVMRCQNPSCNKLILLEMKGRLILKMYPSGKFELKSNIPVPPEVSDEFQEAGLCIGAGCYKASMVMSRRVLQRCLKEQGCTKHKLVDAINEAVENNILRPPFHPVATEIRKYGNLGAHPDDNQLSNITRENAQLVLDFCRMIIHDFYEIPAEVQSLQRKREEPQQ